MKNSKNYVVTLGRQFGCGAREIGQMVAQMLGIGYYDKEILLEAAKSSGVEPAIFEASDERTPKFFSSLWSFNLGYYSGTLFAGDQPVKEDNVYHTQSEVMIIISRGDCATRKEAKDMAIKQNKLRANYYDFYTDKHWGMSESYDLSIDCSKLGPERTAQLIVDYVKTRLSPGK